MLKLLRLHDYPTEILQHIQHCVKVAYIIFALVKDAIWCNLGFCLPDQIEVNLPDW